MSANARVYRLFCRWGSSIPESEEISNSSLAFARSESDALSMLDQDLKRIEREEAIVRSVRGPDYSQLKAQLRAVHAELSQRDGWARASYMERMSGYYRAAREGRIPLVDGKVPAYSETAPGSRLANCDLDFTRR